MKDIQHDIFALQTEPEAINVVVVLIVLIGYVAYNLFKNYDKE